jgi:DNA-directed RNA polymerase subunit RPC12/RpoP
MTLKICGALALISFATLIAVPALLNHRHATAAYTSFVLASITLLASTFYALRQIRCPECGARWLQYAMAEKGVGGWLTWLTSVTECPECGFNSQNNGAKNVKM